MLGYNNVNVNIRNFKNHEKNRGNFINRLADFKNNSKFKYNFKYRYCILQKNIFSRFYVFLEKYWHFRMGTSKIWEYFGTYSLLLTFTGFSSHYFQLPSSKNHYFYNKNSKYKKNKFSENAICISKVIFKFWIVFEVWKVTNKIPAISYIIFYFDIDFPAIEHLI